MARKFKINKTTAKTASSEGKTASSVKEKKEDIMSKEEIKELVEETVDEAIKEEEESEKDGALSDSPVLSTSEVTTEEKSSDDKEDEDSLKGEKDQPKEDEDSLSKEQTSTSETKSTNKAEEDKPSEAHSTSPGQEAKGVVVTPVSIESAPVTGIPTTTSPEGASEVTSSPSGDTAKVDEASNATTSPVISVSSSAPSLSGSVLSEDKKPSKKSPLIVLFIVFVICGFVVGISVLYLLSKNNFKFPTVSSVTSILQRAPTPTPTVMATPTPATAVLSKYKISVLNGSGVAGAAARTKDDLTAAGFTVDNTGNASATTETTIAAKSTVDSATLDKLVQTLSTKYSVSSQTSSLGSSASDDIVVTVGKVK